MKNLLKNVFVFSIAVVIGLSNINFASDFGAEGSQIEKEYTLEEMFKYGLEDEYLAKAEYELIIENFDVNRPFTNILEAEKNHIAALEKLYETYEFEKPEVNPDDYTLLPNSLEEAFETGVEAEIKNIEMYEKFLETDLPEDVRLTFEALNRASENHLKAFERNVSSNQKNNSNIKSRQRGSRKKEVDGNIF